MPPVNVPADHVMLICTALVLAATLDRETGGSGFVTIIAPFPAVEKFEVLTALVADTLA